MRSVTGTFATLPDLLRAVADAYPDIEAFVDGPRRLTFGQWAQAADGVAAHFADLGVAKGDVVCLRLPSSADFAVCYQAAVRLGAVTSGINLRTGPREVASIIARTRPRVVVVDDGLDPPEGVEQVVWRSQLALMAASSLTTKVAHLSPSDPVAVVWTSGTTGQPKGAVFDHDNLRAVADGIGILSRPGDRRLSPLPFSHVGYMTRPWDELTHVITTIIVPTPWSAAEALRLLETERVTVGQGVPAQWALMLAHPTFEATDVSSLRIAGTGASTVPPELVREMRRRLGCPVVVRYTSTEASLTTGTTVGDPDEVVALTVGKASGGVELQVVDDDGHPLAAGDVGTVRCRSGAVMRGYWGDPDKTAEVLSPDGWLLTGDLGRLDEQGRLTLVGRRTEMYIRGGYNVYPAEVETVLSEHPDVAGVAVVGIGDRVLGEIGVAVIVATEGTDPTLEDLRTWCSSRLSDYKAPDRLVRTAELPLTAMSKVDKRALVALVSAAS